MTKKMGIGFIAAVLLLLSHSAVRAEEMADEIKVVLGGELEFEFVDTKNGPATSEPEPYFKIDQLYLYPKVTVGDKVTFKSEVAVKAGTALIEESWVKFSKLPRDLWFEAGLNDMFIANIDRKAEAEILIETAFYRDDDMGIAIGGGSGFYWMASLTNGLKLDSKAPGEDPSSATPAKSNHLIADARNPANAPKHLLAGFGAGIKRDLGGTAKIDLMPFFYTGKLSGDDVTFLTTKVPGYGASADNGKARYGLNTRYDAGKFTLIGQFLKADDGELNRTGWFIQPSAKFNDLEYVYRYNDLAIDLPHLATNSLTWDRSQHLFALIKDLYKGIKLKTEYTLNEEGAGVDLADDELMVQLEVIF